MNDNEANTSGKLPRRPPWNKRQADREKRSRRCGHKSHVRAHKNQDQAAPERKKPATLRSTPPHR